MPDPKYKISQEVLNDFSATVEAKPNLTTQEIFDKFPEFNKDTSALQSAMDYYQTSKSGKYRTIEELNSKFPEFGFDSKEVQQQATQPADVSQQPQTNFGDLNSQISDIRGFDNTINKPQQAQLSIVDPLSHSANVDNTYKQDEQDKSAAATYKKAAIDKLSQGLGVTPDEVTQTLQDFPNLNDAQTLQQYTKLKQDNPNLYNRTVATSTWQSNLLSEVRNTAPDKYDEIVGQIRQMQQGGTGTSFADAQNNLKYTRELINTYIQDPAKKESALNALKEDAAYNYSGETQGTDEVLNNDVNSVFLNKPEKLALQFLKDTGDPSYEGFANNVSVNPATIQQKSASGKPDLAAIGYSEQKAKLASIGTDLQLRAANEHLNTLANIANQQGQLSPEQQQEYQKWNKAKEEAQQLQDRIHNPNDKEYGYAAQFELDNIAQELIGQKNSFLSIQGSEFKNNINAPILSAIEGGYSLFSSDENNKRLQLAVIGATAKSENKNYVTQANQPMRSFEIKLPDDLSDKITDLKNNKTLTNEQKREQIKGILSIDTRWYKQPADSKFNLKGMLLYGVGDAANAISSFLITQAAMGGAGNVSRTSRALTTFSNIMMSEYSKDYADNLKNNEPNPALKALRTSTINGAAFAGGDNAEAIRKLLGNTAAGEVVGKMTDDEILSIVKKKPSSLENLAKGLASSQAGNLQMTAIGSAGQLLNDAANGKMQSPEDYGRQAILMFASNAPISLLGMRGKATQLNELQGHAWYEIANNPEKFLGIADEGVSRGTLSPDAANTIKQNIEKASAVHQSIDYTYDNGKLMSDDDKTKTLLTRIKQDNLTVESKKNSSDKTKTKVEHEAAVTNEYANLIHENAPIEKLQDRKTYLQKQFDAVDENGKSNLNDKDKAIAKAQIDAIDNYIKDKSNEPDRNKEVQNSADSQVNERKPAEETQPANASINQVEQPTEKKQSITVIRPQENIPREITTISNEKESTNQDLSNVNPNNNNPNGLAGNQDASNGNMGSSGDTPSPPQEKVTSAIHAEQPPFTLIKDELRRVRSELGMDDYEGENVSNVEAITKADRTITDWKEKGTYAENIDKIIKDAHEAKISDANQNILAQHIADLRVTKRSMDRTSPEYDTILKELKRAVDAGDAMRSEAGRILGRNKLQMRGKAFDDISTVEFDMMDDKGIEALTPELKAEAEKRFNEVKTKLDEEAKLRIQAEEEIARLKAEQELNKAKKYAKAERKKKNKGDFVKERDEIRQRIRDKLKQSRGQANSITTAAVDFVKIAPDVAKLIASYVHENANIVLDEVRTLLKKDLEDAGIQATDEQVRDLIAGNYNEKKATRSEIAQKVNDLRTEEDLMLEYEKLVNGKVPKSPVKQKAHNARLEELRNQISKFKSDKAAEAKAEDRIKDLENELNRVKSRIEKEPKDANKRLYSEREKDLRDAIDAEKKAWATEKNIDKLAQELERVQKRQEKVTEPKDKKELSDEEKSLQKQIKEENEKWNKELEPARKLAQAEKAAEKSIKDLEDKLAANDLSIKQADKLSSDKLDQLREKQTALREELEARREAAKMGKYSDEEKFKAALKRRIEINKQQQSELEQKIKNNDFTEDAKGENIIDNKEFQKSNPELYEKYVKSIVDKDNAKYEYEQKRVDDKIKNMDFFDQMEHAGDVVLTTSTSTRAAFDLSSTLVQLIIPSMSHPAATVKNIGLALRDLINSNRFDKEMAKVKYGQYGDDIAKSELVLFDTKGEGEDIRNPMSGGNKNLLNRDIGIKGGTKILGKTISSTDKYVKIAGHKLSIGKSMERATATLINNMRVYLFTARVQQLRQQHKTFETHPEEYKAAARAVHELTAHGKVQNDLAKATPKLGMVIWSMKMMASTFNVLGMGDLIRPKTTLKEILLSAGVKKIGGKPIKIDPKATKGFYSSLTSQQRAFVRWELARCVGTIAVTMFAAKLTGWADDVDYNPISTNSFSITKGNKTISLAGRYGSALRAIGEIITATRYIAGQKQELDKPHGKSVGDVAFSAFIRGKMKPNTALAYDYFFNKGKGYYTHEQITAMNAAKSLFTPISTGDIVKDFKRDDAILASVETFGKLLGSNISDKRDSDITLKSKDDILKDNLKSSDIDQSTIKNFRAGGREITDTEYKTFVQKRDAYIKSKIDDWYSKGLIADDGKVKKYNESSADEIKKEMQSIKEAATRKTKELLFGKEIKTSKQLNAESAIRAARKKERK